MRGINHAEDWGWAAAPRLFGTVGAGTAAVIGGSSALSGLSSIVGSGKSSSASKAAAAYSAQSEANSLAFDKQQYWNTESNQTPFMSAGWNALGNMQTLAGESPWGGASYSAAADQLSKAAGYQDQAAGMNPSSVLTEAGLEQTPGYQFTQQQGLKATQAAAAARGLGVSGASLKGAATYATGLADSTYSNRFNEAQQSWQDVMNQGAGALNTATGYVNQANAVQGMQQQQYNQYANLANLGENAAANAGQAGSSAASTYGTTSTAGAQQYGNYLTQAGQAQAAGTTGATNALTSGVNNYLSYSALQQLMGGSGSGTSGFGNIYNSAYSGNTLGS